MIDEIILLAVTAPIWLLLSLVPILNVRIFFLVTGKAVLIYLLKALYFVLLLKFRGATLGKQALRIRVVKQSGEISWVDAIYRETVGRYLSGLILGIGYLMAGFTRNKQALHDKLCDTVVVYDI